LIFLQFPRNFQSSLIEIKRDYFFCRKVPGNIQTIANGSLAGVRDGEGLTGRVPARRVTGGEGQGAKEVE
jgi:hypothetical protein